MSFLLDEEKDRMDVKEPKKQSSNDIQETAFFGAGEDNNILDRSKRNLEKLSWFQRLFK